MRFVNQNVYALHADSADTDVATNYGLLQGPELDVPMSGCQEAID